MVPYESRIQEFYRLPLPERLSSLAKKLGCSKEDLFALTAPGGLSLSAAELLIENVIGTYTLPFAVALNFKINQRDFFVPMVTEEPSVVAAASFAARLIRNCGGFKAKSDPPIMIAQIELRDVPNKEEAISAMETHRLSILQLAQQTKPSLVERGGGVRNLEIRTLSNHHLVVHLLVDCCDAMGANVVNSMAESIAPYLAHLTGARMGLRILSNLADKRLVTVSAQIQPEVLTINEPDFQMDGQAVRDCIIEAAHFAELDPYRAATHNKGIMNGIDAVALATAQDFRGIEAGAHAYAVKNGQYGSLSSWSKHASGDLCVELTLPMAVGTVGGAVSVHPTAQLALKMMGHPSTEELGQVIAAAGLASNFSALRALATEGIQRGHMSLHRRRLELIG